MYHVSAQGVDERMINVHYYYYYIISFLLLLFLTIFIQFLSMWTCKYMYTPGIHINPKLIYADYAMVYKTKKKEKEKKRKKQKKT